jgi:hypothetical protein
MANMAIKTRRSTNAPAPAMMPISAARFKPELELLASVLTSSAFASMDDGGNSELEDVGVSVSNVERLEAIRSKTKVKQQRRGGSDKSKEQIHQNG